MKWIITIRFKILNWVYDFFKIIFCICLNPCFYFSSCPCWWDIVGWLSTNTVPIIICQINRGGIYSLTWFINKPKLICTTRKFQNLNLLIHHIQIIIIIISHRIAWCFSRGQGVWLGFAFVPAFELIGFAVCLIGIWQGATLFKSVRFTINNRSLSLCESWWWCNFLSVTINKILIKLFVINIIINSSTRIPFIELSCCSYKIVTKHNIGAYSAIRTTIRYTPCLTSRFSKVICWNIIVTSRISCWCVRSGSHHTCSAVWKCCFRWC